MKSLQKVAFVAAVSFAVALASGCQKNASQDATPKSGANDQSMSANPPSANADQNSSGTSSRQSSGQGSGQGSTQSGQ